MFCHPATPEPTQAQRYATRTSAQAVTSSGQITPQLRADFVFLIFGYISLIGLIAAARTAREEDA